MTQTPGNRNRGLEPTARATARPTVRPVSPRGWAMLATSVALGAALPVAQAVMAPPAAHASEATPAPAPAPAPASAATGSETGEGGESGHAMDSAPIRFLTDLDMFEAAYTIAAAQYAGGDRAGALEQLETSHHALYADLAPHLAEIGAPGFADAVRAFHDAIARGAPEAEVSARLDTLLAAIDAARAAADATPVDRVMVIRNLLNDAAADFAGGVENGEILSAHEYRDAWGFFHVAKARAQALADSTDPALSQAGHDVLAQIDRAAPLFPTLDPATAPGDPASLSVAAAWIEIIGLRLQ